MKTIKKINLINLLILLVYTVIIGLIIPHGRARGIEVILLSSMAVGLHVLTLFIIGIIYYFYDNYEKGNAYMLSSGVVLLIGFSACMGNSRL